MDVKRGIAPQQGHTCEFSEPKEGLKKTARKDKMAQTIFEITA